MSAAQKIQQHPVFVQVQKKAVAYHTQLDAELSKYPTLITLEQRTQVPKTYLFSGAIFLVFFFHLFNAFAGVVSNLIGFALPAYFSFLAIESHQTTDDTQWLTYWVVFGFLNFVENVAVGTILSYLPWYFTLKTLFVVWLQLPATRGAQKLYNGFLRSLFISFLQDRAVAPITSSSSTAESHTE